MPSLIIPIPVKVYTRKQWLQLIDCLLAEIGLTLEVFLELDHDERARALYGSQVEMMLNVLKYKRSNKCSK